MADFGRRWTLSAAANADLSTKQYHIVRFAGSNLVDQASQAAAGFAVGAVGVLQDKPLAGGAAQVAYMGESKVVVGGAITAGVLLATNGSGRAAAATSGDLIFGRALEAAATDGQVIRALLFPVVRLSGAV